MTRAFLESLKQSYLAYTDTFRQEGVLPLMMRLKLEHTRKVVEAAVAILEGESAPEPLRIAGEACALLHDAGRYGQLARYGTFRDADSVDHADFGAAVIEEQGWLAQLPEAERRMVLDVVRCHNKRELPVGMPDETVWLAHLVRDADKLDIFRVLEVSVRDRSLEEHPEIAWGLPVTGLPSANVAEAVCAGRSIPYGWIRNLADFVLIQVGWLNGGLHFRSALRLAEERKVLAFRRAFLKQLAPPDAAGAAEIDRICDRVQDAVRQRLEGG